MRKFRRDIPAAAKIRLGLRIRGPDEPRDREILLRECHIGYLNASTFRACVGVHFANILTGAVALRGNQPEVTYICTNAHVRTELAVVSTL
jgi:hypothetical protein